jgi:hypothetical protein
MQFQIMTQQDKVTVYADVTKIVVEDIVKPSEDAVDEIYYRTIRFVGSDGEAIEVFCSSSEEEDLAVHSCCCGKTALSDSM